MANPQFLRERSVPTMLAFDTTDTTVTFSPGDLLILSSGKVVALGTTTVTTNFVGAAAQKKIAGTTGLGLRLFGNSQDGKIRVDTDGVWEYERSDTIALVPGDFVGPDGTTANTLKKVGAASIAVGVVVEDIAATNATTVTLGTTNNRVRIHLLSAKLPASLNT